MASINRQQMESCLGEAVGLRDAAAEDRLKALQNAGLMPESLSQETA